MWATDRLARYVGVKAYEQAGGAVVHGLFGEDEDSYLADRNVRLR